MATTVTDLHLEAPHDTDIWRKPPSHDVFNAPFKSVASFPLPDFKSVRITFSAAWEQQYDQAGILLQLTQQADPTPSRQNSWIKAGLELYDSTPHISFVGCDRYADWSVHALHGKDPAHVTVELRREGFALWAYELVLDGKGEEVERWPVRECTWLWSEEEKTTVDVAAYCARPSKAPDGERAEPLKVHFEKVEVVTQ